MNAIFITVFVSLFLCIYTQHFLSCSSKFCETYLDKQPCRELSEACKAQNFTHNGLELPFPGPCNCCDYCLENIAEEKSCSIGDPTSPTPTTICGDGLSCELKKDANNKDKPICEKIKNTACTQAQMAYDQKRKTGKLGHLQQRAECDRNGLYLPYKCVPGEICYCVSEDGERIFGEIPFTANPEYLLRCKCSRDYHKAKVIRNRNLHHNEFLRCQSNGDYDTLQCIENKCLCVDAEDGHPTYPESSLINITLISASTLPCFNNETHMEAEYYRDCEALYIEQINFNKKAEEHDHEVIGYTLPNCQLDGYYAPVQKSSSTKYCSDPHGKKLENYEVPKSDRSPMDCKCARSRSIMIGDENPECCDNGNYKKVQCRRGWCYCVNENGIQTGQKVEYHEKQTLRCI